MSSDTGSIRSSSPPYRASRADLTSNSPGEATRAQICANGGVSSTYDWPMTRTEKLMVKYAYKADLLQYTRRIDAVWSQLGSEKRDSVLQALKAINQLMSDVRRNADSSGEMISALCAYIQQKGDLDLLLKFFGGDSNEMRFEAGKVIECSLSTTSSSSATHGYVKELVCAVVNESDKKDEANTILSVILLEALFCHGLDYCRITVDNGGLDYLIEICKTRMDVETLLHTAGAFSNLAIFGGSEMHKLMVLKHVPIWLFVLASHDDRLVKYYGCLAFCAIVSTPDIERSVKECDTVGLVRGFLRTCKLEDMTKLNDKYRSGRSIHHLTALAPMLRSQTPEVSCMAAFQLAMEASAFNQLGFTARIKEIASTPEFELGNRFAVHILKAMGEAVPYKLTQAVPSWTIKDVQFWLKKVGYSEYTESFARHRVDGDLLLQTNSDHLRDEVGMDSAYDRMRFMRELNSLKRSADYNAIDRGRLDSWLINLDAELSVYTYPMLLKGVDRATLIHLNEEILRDICGIANGIHRWKILRAIKEAKHEADLDLIVLRKKVDVFISYRRSTGGQLASLLKVHLQLSGYKVFIDVDRLHAGQFNKSILMNVRAAKHFIIVLTPHALDSCVGDDECRDWLHLELKTALECGSNIIPVQEKGFEWPPAETLPADMQALCGFSAIQWVHDYQQACIEKLHKKLVGAVGSGGASEVVQE